MRSEIGANGSVAVGSDVAVEVVATLGSLTIDDVRVEVVAGDAGRRGRAWSPRRVVEGIHEGAAGRRGSASSPWCPRPRAAAWRSPRASCRCGPTAAGTEPGFLIAWEPD